MQKQSGEFLQLLLDLVHDANQAPDLRGALAALLKHLRLGLPCDGAAVMWLDEDHLEVLASSGSGAALPGLVLPVSQMGAAALLVDGATPVLVSDTLQDPRWRVVPGEERVRCWLAAPLLVEDRPVGLVEWTALERERFSEQDLDVSAAMAAQVAPVVHRARLLEEMRRRLRESTGSQEEAEWPGSSGGPDLQALVREAREFTAARHAFVFVLDDTGQRLVCAAAAGEAREQLKAVSLCGDGTLEGWRAAAVRGPRRFGGGQSDRKTMAAIGIRNTLILPIRLGGQQVGLLGIAEPERGRGFDQDSAKILMHLASQASLVLERSYRPQGEVESWDYAAVVQSSPLGVSVLTVTGDVGLCNPALLALFGHPAGGLVGRNLSEFLVATDGQRLNQVLEEVAITGQRQQVEARVRSDPGQRRTVRISLSSPGSGDRLGHNLVAIMEDVTSLKILERERVGHLRELREQHDRLAELDRLKSRFVSNVSHELRTPLAVIKLYATLSRKGRPDKQAHYLETIEREVQRLETLVENVLDLTRMDRQALAVHPAWLDAGAVVAQVVGLYQETARRKEIELTGHLQPGLPPLWADRDHVVQMLTNLLDNALKYTARGGTVWVSASQEQDEARRTLRISVRDTGPGIPPEEQEKVFERFYRGSASPSGSTGAGLGLAIVRELMAHHNGEVTLESAVGVGSLFTLHFPLAAREDSPEPEEPPAAEREK